MFRPAPKDAGFHFIQALYPCLFLYQGHSFFLYRRYYTR